MVEKCQETLIFINYNFLSLQQQKVCVARTLLQMLRSARKCSHSYFLRSIPSFLDPSLNFVFCERGNEEVNSIFTGNKGDISLLLSVVFKITAS